MLKIKLKENIRYYDTDDSDYKISGKIEKDLPEKYFRSYSIKYHLFHGLFEVISGSAVFHMKSARIYVAPNTLYACEYGKYFTKDLELDTITFIAEDQVPKEIAEQINPTTKIEEFKTEIEIEVKTEEPIATDDLTTYLSGFTKDELNDMAAQEGYTEQINPKMKKADMIETFKILLGEKDDKKE